MYLRYSTSIHDYTVVRPSTLHPLLYLSDGYSAIVARNELVTTLKNSLSRYANIVVIPYIFGKLGREQEKVVGDLVKVRKNVKDGHQ